MSLAAHGPAGMNAWMNANAEAVVMPSMRSNAPTTATTLFSSPLKVDWLRGDGFEAGIRRLAARLSILWDGTVLDGELTADRFYGTMAALHLILSCSLGHGAKGLSVPQP